MVFNHRLLTGAVLLFCFAFITGCGSRPVSTLNGLADALRKGGLQVTTGNASFSLVGTTESNRIFSVNATNLGSAGGRISVLQYPDAGTAGKEAGYVSTDGYDLRTGNIGASVDWIAPPHWYRSDRIIVLYVGDNSDLLLLLGKVLGRPFAGAGSGVSQ